MTNLDVTNSSTDSSSGSSSDSSSSGSSSTSSGSGSSSSDSDSSTSDPPQNNTAAAPKSPAKPAKEPTPPPKKKEEPKPTRNSTKKISSSEDDVRAATPPKPLLPRRRSSTKSKQPAAVLAKVKPGSRPTGAKAKPVPKVATKPPPSSSKNDSTKKKSIFSPDNSSESDSGSKSSKSTKDSQKSKRGSRKSSEDASPTILENDDSNSKDSKRRSVTKLTGPPIKKAVELKSETSCTSSQSSVESVSSDSDSEPTPKKEPNKSGKTKPPSSNSSKQESGKSDSLDAATLPRKQTRSFARVSRLATKSRPLNTDTDSEVDDKSHIKSKDSKKFMKGRPAVNKSPIVELSPPEPYERRCPVRGCDSNGHLGGKASRHFTWDACPLYHNVSAAWCVAAGEERAAAAAARRRALAHMAHRPRAQPTIDQRAYQLKVKVSHYKVPPPAAARWRTWRTDRARSPPSTSAPTS